MATHFIESRKIPDLESELVELKSPSNEAVASLLDTHHNKTSLDADKPFVLAQHVQDIDRLFSGSSVEEIVHNLKTDDSAFASKQTETLSKMSPTSLKLTFRQLQAGASLSLREVLQMEYRLAQACMRGHDFYEGVRAVLIDKDHSPKWRPSSLQEVADDSIEHSFSPMGDKDLHF